MPIGVMIWSAMIAVALQVETITPTLRESRVWEGWGTSLAWLGKVFGEREDLADLLFSTKSVTIEGQTVPGLGMNIVRYNAGACSDVEVEGRRIVINKTILPFRQIEGLWLDPTLGKKGWNWDRDLAQRTMLMNAKKRGANKFELFSNSPMWWMTKNANPAGAEKATDDNLSEDMYAKFAEYLATIAEESPKRWGVRFTSVEPFNEPASDYWYAENRQEGCHFSVGAQMKFLPVLRKELDRRGLKSLAIAASDETSYTHALDTWSKFDEETRKLVDQVNVHGYEDNAAKRMALAEALGDKARWNSERGDGDDTGLSMARELTRDMNVLRISAWCYWQPFDGGGWGFLDCDMPKALVKKINRKLFVAAQYLRHIRPGMMVLQSNSDRVVTAYDARRQTLVVVAQNTGEAAEVVVQLPANSERTRSAKVWSTMSSGNENYSMVTIPKIGSEFRLELPKGAVITVEISGVVL
ncbi:MAG TPA: glycoside hydrolase [Fimbriimonas sp.]|nr:glycoside hydrolase [Fimbriimonas sp.]